MIRLLKFAVVAALVGAPTTIGIIYATDVTPDDLARYRADAEAAGARVWANVESNPTPWAFTVGMFLLTVCYHRVRGASTRQALEAAALRSLVVVQQATATLPESDVLTRAKNRTTKTQLIQDRFVLENRDRATMAEISAAEKDSAWADREAEVAVEIADRKRALAHTVHKKLASLRVERETTAAELVKIDAELSRLAPLV